MKFEFFDIFSKNTQMSNFMKTLPVGAEFSMRSDVQTDG
jgi:hypothetical protein